MNRPQHTSRRGVLLLVILGLLAMFGLLAITFVIVAGHHQKTAQIEQTFDAQLSVPEEDLKIGLMQVLRDTSDHGSALQGTSLLSDMYGVNAVHATMVLHPDNSDQYAIPIAGGQLLEIRADPDVFSDDPDDLSEYDTMNGLPTPLYFSPRNRVGCVLTMTSGPARGQSTRIVAHRCDPSSDTHYFQIIAFEATVINNDDAVDVAGYPLSGNYLVNGAPFSGAGAGFNPFTGRLDASYASCVNPKNPEEDIPSLPLALLPRPFLNDAEYDIWLEYIWLPGLDRSPGSLDDHKLPDWGVVPPPNVCNEDYDAPDFQNPLLALTLVEGGKRFEGTTNERYRPLLPPGTTLAPSLHNTALINYWYNKLQKNPLSFGTPASYSTPGAKALAMGFDWADDSIVGNSQNPEMKWKAILLPFGDDRKPLGGDDNCDLARAVKINRLKRKLSARPLAEDHWGFDGSNAASRREPVINATGVQQYWERGDLDICIDPETGNEMGLYAARPAWDVDNDGDGLPDSVWVDLGSPIRTMPDGRKYKVLYAILVRDLDGRLNVNAQGCVAQLTPKYYGQDPPIDVINPNPLLQLGSAAYIDEPFKFCPDSTDPTTLTDFANLPLGQGYGPAEISLLPLFSLTDVVSDVSQFNYNENTGEFLEYSNLLRGAHLFPGRYGYPDDDSINTASRPGVSNNLSNNQNWWDRDDLLSQNKSFDYWNSAVRNHYSDTISLPDDVFGYWSFFDSTDPFVIDKSLIYGPTNFGSPPDFNGDGAIGLDPQGQPMYVYMADKPDWKPVEDSYEHIDDPYELHLVRNSSRMNGMISRSDNPFTPDELERILRSNDADSRTLAPRLSALAPILVDPNMRRRRLEVTTESWSLPCPNVSVPPHMIKELHELEILDPPISSTTNTTLDRTPLSELIVDLRWFPARHVQDLIGLSIVLAYQDSNFTSGLPAKDTQAFTTMFNASIGHLLPPEMRAGLKMNLNRPFGNGIDDNGNGVIDEPGRVIRNGDVFELHPDFPGEIHEAGSASNDRERLAQVDASGAPILDAYLDHVNGIDVNGDGIVNDADRAMVRQLYARYIYVLAMMTVDLENLDAMSKETDAKEKRKDSARRIAQWAVNVVDFRDRDLISTPFEYDIYPFLDNNTDDDSDDNYKTWNVDGFLDEDDHQDSDDDKEWRGLVWGCERPELLLTETVAVHDRRTQDLVEDKFCYPKSDTNNTDTDLDSKKRPKGSLFIELYNPWSVLEPKSGDLYDAYNGGVDLSRIAYDDQNNLSYPVWRITIFKPDEDDKGQVSDRSIYFVDAEEDSSNNDFNIPADEDGLQHYPSNTQTSMIIRPGQYAVIGPGDQDETPGDENKTYISKIPREDPITDTAHILLDPDREDGLNFNVISNRVDGEGDLDAFWNDNKINDPVAIVIDKANVQSGYQKDSKNLRLSISEPKQGYPTKDPDGTDFDKSTQEYLKTFDEPLDVKLSESDWADGETSGAIIAQDGTHLAVRVACLERLANPNLPWEKTSNPYIQIDSLVIDLSTYNFVEEDPAHQIPGSNPAGFTDGFFSRERGEVDDGVVVDDVDSCNLWPQVPRGDKFEPQENEGVSVTDQEYDKGFDHTLGYLNWDLTCTSPDTNAVDGPRPIPDPNDPNPPPLGDPDDPVLYRGTPAQPFPWLTWNNRPFINELELMLVPLPSASILLRNSEDHKEHETNPNLVPEPLFGLRDTNEKPYEELDTPFRHLPNFWHSGESLKDNSTDTSLQLHRLLEYVYVPSRFVGTETQCNPSMFVSPTVDNNSDFPNNTYEPTHTFSTPFQMIPTYREPGRINLNTIFSVNVFRGLMNLDSSREIDGIDDIWDVFRQSRRACKGDPTGGDPTKLSWNNDSPTRIEAPFRSAAGGYLVPPLYGTDPNLLRPEREVNVSLLRSDPTNSNKPLFCSDTTDPRIDAERNPFFHSQRLRRLGNLTTTHSNAYAVWITVGYFEVRRIDREERPDLDDPNFDEFAAIYPDGHTLMGELGNDTGEIKRHRAFYLIDRSIPVGFEPGRDYNVKNTILLERYIE